MTKVLIVEDELRIRQLLADILLDAGYDVVEAQHGGEGLDKVYAEQPNIILLDVMMPVMDGLQMLEQLKQDPTIQAIPVIMVTAKGQEQDVLRAQELGASDYIFKPWEPDEIECKVKSIESEIRPAN